MAFLRVTGAQIDLTVGDLTGNRERILDAMAWAEGVQADVLVLPELAVTGYPPEDLVLREGFIDANLRVVADLAKSAEDVVTVVGFVDRAQPRSDDSFERPIANAAALLHRGELRGVYHKVALPNFGVFDEDRYFTAGVDDAGLWSMGSVSVGVSVCEDIWLPDGPPLKQATAGAGLLLNINGSPYHRGKGEEREALLSRRARQASTPLVYLNLVGAQDELVFDGQSMVFDASGELLYRAPQFTEQRFWVDVPVSPRRSVGATPVARSGLLEGLAEAPPPSAEPLGDTEELYRALEAGLRGYVAKNGFTEVVVGLSGGIDSAVTAAIAADALGAGAVWGVAMPTRFSSEQSVSDAADLADRLGIRFDVVPVDDLLAGYLTALGPVFGTGGFGVAEENLQARIRGAVLMAISNKLGPMVVATGNKSELAVGYATLYGDMAGGFAVLKDVFKTTVYELADWRNLQAPVIPPAIILKPPSAELRPGQLDSDSLPPYEVLDLILEQYVERDERPSSIVEAGFDPDVVNDIVAKVDRNEYKRRQAAPGVRVTRKAFGRDRRLPITNKFRHR